MQGVMEGKLRSCMGHAKNPHPPCRAPSPLAKKRSGRRELRSLLVDYSPLAIIFKKRYSFKSLIRELLMDFFVKTGD